MKLKDAYSLEGKFDQLSIFKSRDITLPTKVCLVYGFFSSHVWMWELDYKESWDWRIDVLNCGVGEDSWEFLDFKEIQPVRPKGDQSWVFIGRTDVEPETPVFWPPDVKSWLIGKDPVARRVWGQEEKGTTEDEMVGWHHQLNGHEFGWTPGVGDGQGGLACYGTWGCKESDTTEWLNWTELICYIDNKNSLIIPALVSLVKTLTGVCCSSSIQEYSYIHISVCMYLLQIEL